MQWLTFLALYQIHGLVFNIIEVFFAESTATTLLPDQCKAVLVIDRSAYALHVLCVGRGLFDWKINKADEVGFQFVATFTTGCKILSRSGAAARLAPHMLDFEGSFFALFVNRLVKVRTIWRDLRRSEALLHICSSDGHYRLQIYEWL